MHLVLRTFCAFAVLTCSATAAGKPNVDPDSLAALDKMGAYLRSLSSFEIKTDTVTDAVLDNGQKVQFAGSANYKVRRPNAFAVSVSDDRRVRRFLYDGKTFTIYSPRMGFYASVPTKPTIREMMANIYDKFKIELPLADLFRWGTDDDHRDAITSAVTVGYAKINGVDTDQYAFREGNIDWQVWIQRGDKPLPQKIVITDTSDNAMPEYGAVLHWNTTAKFDNATFAFNPPKNAKSITIASR